MHISQNSGRTFVTLVQEPAENLVKFNKVEICEVHVLTKQK